MTATNETCLDHCPAAWVRVQLIPGVGTDQLQTTQLVQQLTSEPQFAKIRNFLPKGEQLAKIRTVFTELLIRGKVERVYKTFHKQTNGCKHCLSNTHLFLSTTLFHQLVTWTNRIWKHISRFCMEMYILSQNVRSLCLTWNTAWAW